jgi:hypothetical protein
MKLVTKINISLIVLLILFLATGSLYLRNNFNDKAVEKISPLSTQGALFDGHNALQLISHQLEFGARTPSSVGHQRIVEWIQHKLTEYGWNSELQVGVWSGYPIVNIIGKKGHGKPWIILGAHYDTRIYADKDPDIVKRNFPVPGANDGGSGVALLLELARVLPVTDQGEIWMVFFDAEDNGGILGREWAMGSRLFVDELVYQPDGMVLVDMVADKDLNIYMERNSSESMMNEIWEVAADLGYSDHFIPRKKYAIIDDHIPFLEAGIPAVDIIDFDYPFHHTTRDTLDAVSAHSLQVVGETLLAWLRDID